MKILVIVNKNRISKSLRRKNLKSTLVFKKLSVQTHFKNRCLLNKILINTIRQEADHGESGRYNAEGCGICGSSG